MKIADSLTLRVPRTYHYVPDFFDAECQARNITSQFFCAQTANPVILRSGMTRIAISVNTIFLKSLFAPIL